MGITEQVLAEHAVRKDKDGITWFMAEDLQRMGIREPLFTVMQTVQHTLKLRKSFEAVESHGCTDRWSIEDTH